MDIPQCIKPRIDCNFWFSYEGFKKDQIILTRSHRSVNCVKFRIFFFTETSCYLLSLLVFFVIITVLLENLSFTKDIFTKIICKFLLKSQSEFNFI